MTPTAGRSTGERDWEAVKRLFAEARAQPEDRREAWLAAAGADPAVVAEVRSLIGSLERAGDFLEPPEPSAVSAAARSLLAGVASACRFAPGDRLGRYEIVGLLGAGGMGEVYRASDTRLDRTVVLKVLPAQTAIFPEWRTRLEREARAVSSLKHPHVCALHDIGQEGDVDFLVMEHLDGETLAERLRRGALPIADVVAWGLQIAGALDAAHEHGIVHRDLKPANIMLTPSGAKLLDFGVAKAAPAVTAGVAGPASQGTAAESITQHGVLIGTAEYMAPEQVDGRPLDRRADIFAFGAVLYEMTTGRKSFAADDRVSVLEAVRTRDVPPLRRLRRRTPRSLDHVVRTCLAKERGARYQTAAAVQRDLMSVAVSERRFRRGRWLAATVLTLAALLGLTSPLLNLRQPPAAGRDARMMLAVLPLENLSGKQEQEYISDGMTEELITQLSRVEPDHLAVIARTSSMEYKGTKKKVDEIGRELGVDYLLEGGIRHEGDRIRVSAQLIRVRDQTQLWAQTYERDLRDILELQSDIAHAVADEIQLQLTPQRRTQLASSRALEPDVYVAYLRGRYFWSQRGTDGLRKAIAQFELAVEKDPAFAPAYAGLADCYNLLSTYQVAPPDEAFPKAREAALRALALDDTLAAAHTSLAYTRFRFEWAWDEAEREFQRAIALEPGYATAHHWYGEFLAAMGRYEEGLAELHRAAELDPLSLIINADLGWFLDNAGFSDRALQQLRRTIDLEPNFARAHLYLGQVYERKGLYAQATAAYQRSADLSPSRSRPAALGHLYAISGNRAEATKIIDELLQRPHPSPVAVAIVYAGLGDLDRAFEWLERGYHERSDWLIYLPSYPFYDPLRGDPRFRDLLRRMKLPESNNHR